MDRIHIIVDGLIHGLDPILHIDLALKELCLMDAGQLLDLPDQRHCLLMCDEFRRLHAIHKQFQLRKLEIPLRNIVALEPAGIHMDDIQAIKAQSLNVIVNTLALGTDALGAEILHDLLDGDRMLLIRVLKQVIHDI